MNFSRDLLGLMHINERGVNVIRLHMFSLGPSISQIINYYMTSYALKL